MTGILDRLGLILSAKANKLLDRAEDPNETIDEAFRRQQETLQTVKQAIAEVITNKKRLELKRNDLAEDLAKLDRQAKEAVDESRDDLARLALSRKETIQGQIVDLDRQIVEIKTQQDKLTAAQEDLENKINAFRTKKETLKAQYETAQAQVKVTQAFTGVGKDLNSAGAAMERAEDNVREMQAKAAALDEMVDKGQLADLSGADDIDRELAKGKKSSVEDELAKLKANKKGLGQ